MKLRDRLVGWAATKPGAITLTLTFAFLATIAVSAGLGLAISQAFMLAGLALLVAIAAWVYWDIYTVRRESKHVHDVLAQLGQRIEEEWDKRAITLNGSAEAAGMDLRQIVRDAVAGEQRKIEHNLPALGKHTDRPPTEGLPDGISTLDEFRLRPIYQEARLASAQGRLREWCEANQQPLANWRRWLASDDSATAHQPE